MRPFKQELGEPEARAVTFMMFPGISRDLDTEGMPRLLCASACGGIDMQSLDLLRFDGKPGSDLRGAVTYSVDEDDLRAELRMKSAADSTVEQAAYGEDYIADLKSTANAFRRLDGGGTLNFMFVLYGPEFLIFSPRQDDEDPEEELAETDDELDDW